MKPNPKHLIEQNKIKNRSDLHVTLGFDRKVQTWKFIGYMCSKCNNVLKTVYVATKHVCQPQRLRQLAIRENTVEPENIRTVSGRPYKKIKLTDLS